MKKIDSFKILGTAVNSKKQQPLEEIVIIASPQTLREIAVFLINAAYEMEVNDFDHMHLQDSIANFSSKKHADIIAHIDYDTSNPKKSLEKKTNEK